MQIRNYQPGDEAAQANIYNTVAGPLPAFKPATADEIARRYRADSDPASKFYAIENGQIVGYAVFSPNGRISYPWCLPNAKKAQGPLLEAVLSGLRSRGRHSAWASYRVDWKPILVFLEDHDFVKSRDLINYVAEVQQLPESPAPQGHIISALVRADVPLVWEMGRSLFRDLSTEDLERFYFANPYFQPNSVFTLKRKDHAQLLGVGVAIINPQYADPTKIDPAMPCFRLGAIGTESERHKRMNGLFSCIFRSEVAAEALLAEAARRFQKANLAHAAAQAPSDQVEMVKFYDRYFTRQGSFPVLSRSIG